YVDKTVKQGVTYKYTVRAINGNNASSYTSSSSVIFKNTVEQTVYRTPTGKRYHLDAECGGKNSYAVSLKTAKNAGLTPCQKCAK
ncbi:MAG: hypothetical protein IKC01_07520, partial [Clostridia bacterium]|nr:hypothetical protein [Clostridia bacterium]